MIEIGATCVYRFFKSNNQVVSIHHKSKKVDKHSIYYFNKAALCGHNNDAIYTNLVKKYIGSDWERAFQWAGWAKKRLCSSLDYRTIAMLFHVDGIVSDSYESPAIAKHKIVHIARQGSIPDMTDYNWLSSIKYPVTLFRRPQDFQIEVSNLFHYRASLAIRSMEYYDYDEEFRWLVLFQADVRFKNVSSVYRWVDAISLRRRSGIAINNYQDVNSWPDTLYNEVPF